MKNLDRLRAVLTFGEPVTVEATTYGVKYRMDTMGDGRDGVIVEWTEYSAGSGMLMAQRRNGDHSEYYTTWEAYDKALEAARLWIDWDRRDKAATDLQEAA